jgi:hypothetical protein
MIVEMNLKETFNRKLPRNELQTLEMIVLKETIVLKLQNP